MSKTAQAQRGDYGTNERRAGGSPADEIFATRATQVPYEHPERDARSTGRARPIKSTYLGERYLVDRRVLKRIKPKVNLAIVFSILGLTFLGSMLAFSKAVGEPTIARTGGFHTFMAQFNALGSILGIVFQGIVTAIQWTYADQRKSAIWIIPTALSTLGNVYGYWLAGTGLFYGLARLLKADLDPVFANVLTFVLLFAVSLYTDIYPEKELVGENND